MTDTSEIELSPRQGYAAWADQYDSDGNPLIALEGPAMAARYGPVEGRTVLDLGCGTGRHALELVRRGARVVALDGSPEMLAQARAKDSEGTINWVLHELLDPLRFPDSTFDLVVLGLVAEHLERLAPVLTEVARVLRPGGRCLLSALHPDRTAEGQRARFIDPDSGERRHILTVHREEADYLAAGRAAGLIVEEALTLTVSSELARSLPRAARYAGQRLGWMAAWTKPA